MQPTTMPCAEQTADYLSFRLGGLDYGLPYGRVRELRPFRELDRFSSEGALLHGVAVSRGMIIPIVDMRAAFGLSNQAPDPQLDVIILQLSSCVMGMLVDEVGDIVSLGNGNIHPLPGLGTVEADYLIGLGLAAGRRLILLDIDRLMAIRPTHPVQAA
ncbi:chemotaxis protein CheW [Janthinobacterium sp. PC23-8]|uniref:chemotaxis protein CheW n=1 Tax=Janthinobacterium sp. PC23-8 TaxID=2012679 RepID=UPI000B96E83D|nr:chemotaxis protein CheW [Janthinobacterium sp. PC23-8]OYO30010.1 chemotaxis protein CheW [Janthinobacterium sp. PC23-8]